MRTRVLVLLAILCFGGFLMAGAQESSEQLFVTVYNEGSALIREQRRLALDEGINDIQLGNIAETIDPASVSLRSVSQPGGVTLLEQHYVHGRVNSELLLARQRGETISITTGDGTVYTGELVIAQGREAILRLSDDEIVLVNLDNVRDIRFPGQSDTLVTEPGLRWLLQSAIAGEQDLELSYLARGMNWTADYNLLLNRDETALDLTSWVTLDNHSGKAFENARLKLVAGQINRVQPEPVFAQTRMLAMDAAVEESAPAEQRELFEYKLYDMARSLSISSGESKQIEFLSASSVVASSSFIFDSSPEFGAYYSPIDYPEGFGAGGGDVLTWLEFNTGEESGLGMALPAGRVRVYQADVDGALLLIGEDRLEHRAEGEDVRILLGKAFDLAGERVQTEFETVSRRVVRESFEIRLRNHKEDETVEIRVPERLYRWSDWQIIESSADFEKLDASTIEFRVAIEAGAEAMLNYTVEYNFPRNW